MGWKTYEMVQRQNADGHTCKQHDAAHTVSHYILVKTFTLKHVVLLFLFHSSRSAHRCAVLTTPPNAGPCAAVEKLITLPSVVMTHETQRWPAASLCEERGWMERDDEEGGAGMVFERGSLKMQEDCYSTQMWLLFPACIQCLGNTKLIVTAWRALSVLKHASLGASPSLLPLPLAYNSWCCLCASAGRLAVCLSSRCLCEPSPPSAALLWHLNLSGLSS